MKKTILTQWICPVCGSNHVQVKYWVGLNDQQIDFDNADDDEYWCEDCQQNYKSIETRDIKCFNGRPRIQGYQVVDKNNELHPEMEASFCLYSLKQARAMMLKDMVDGKHVKWQLLTCYKGDVEEPTLMYEGKDPRED